MHIFVNGRMDVWQDSQSKSEALWTKSYKYAHFHRWFNGRLMSSFTDSSLPHPSLFNQTWGKPYIMHKQDYCLVHKSSHCLVHKSSEHCLVHKLGFCLVVQMLALSCGSVWSVTRIDSIAMFDAESAFCLSFNMVMAYNRTPATPAKQREAHNASSHRSNVKYVLSLLAPLDHCQSADNALQKPQFNQPAMSRLVSTTEEAQAWVNEVSTFCEETISKPTLWLSQQAAGAPHLQGCMTGWRGGQQWVLPCPVSNSMLIMVSAWRVSLGRHSSELAEAMDQIDYLASRFHIVMQGSAKGYVTTLYKEYIQSISDTRPKGYRSLLDSAVLEISAIEESLQEHENVILNCTGVRKELKWYGLTCDPICRLIQ